MKYQVVFLLVILKFMRLQFLNSVISKSERILQCAFLSCSSKDETYITTITIDCLLYRCKEWVEIAINKKIV